MSIWSRRATQQPARRSVEQGPRLRGCDRGGVHGHADSIRCAWPAAGSHLRQEAQALLRPPRAVLAATRVGRGAVARPLGQGEDAVAKRPRRGAYCCRSPLQYRHIAAGNPPKSASHIASVAHVPEIGSNHGAAGGAGVTRRRPWTKITNHQSRCTRSHLKNKMQPQMDTDIHRYQNPAACLAWDFIRVHLCLSVVNPACQDF
jgi:hypothetical protein